MKAAPIVLAMFLAVVACSSRRMHVDGGSDTTDREDGTSDAGNGATDVSVGDTADAVGGDGSTDVPDAPRQRLCDGEQHLRLWVLIEVGGLQAAGSYVRTENGSPVLTVDGTCSYWVGAGWSEDALRPDRPFRTGKLTDEDVRAIEESVLLDDVAALADCVPNANIPDGSTLVIRTAAASAVCGGVSSAEYPGTRFAAAWAAVRTVARKLWEGGTPMDGAIHVSATRANWGASVTPAPYAWPIASPLSSFILADADRSKTGVSRLLDDPDSARQLRTLRDQYLADRTAQPGLYVWDGLRTTDQVTPANVYMRDAIPYEDAQGLLKF